MTALQSAPAIAPAIEPNATGAAANAGVSAIADTGDWKSSLPDDLKADPSLATIKDIPSLAKGYVSAQKMVGAKGLIVPGKDAKPEEVSAFYTALGRPEKADGYKVPTENMPEGVELRPDLLAKAYPEFHALGITEQQAAGLLRLQAHMAHGEVQAQAQAKQQQIQTNIAAVKKDWGNAFEEKDRLATLALTTAGGDELVALVKGHPELATNPMFLNAMAKLGKEFAQDEIKGGGHRTGFAMSPSEAAGALAMKKNDTEFMKAYRDNSHPDHSAAVAEMNKLYAAKNPQEPNA